MRSATAQPHYDIGRDGSVRTSMDVRRTDRPAAERLRFLGDWRPACLVDRASTWGRSEPTGQLERISELVGWHTLRVRMRADHVEVLWDGRTVIDARDNRFSMTARLDPITALRYA